MFLIQKSVFLLFKHNTGRFITFAAVACFVAARLILRALGG
ncbi:hypothetical protein [Rhodocaloribacter sp.]